MLDETDTDFEAILEKIGLTKNESKVYRALLTLGPSMAGNIAKKAFLHRSPTYDSLHRLAEKGLVTYTTHNKQKRFQTTNPERLINELHEYENTIQQLIPKLMEKYKSKKSEVLTEIYLGKKGLQAIFDDILCTKEKFYSIGVTGIGFKIMPQYMEHFEKKRVDAGIEREVLLANNLIGKSYYKNFREHGLIKIKFLPKEVINPQVTFIYGNKIVLALISESNIISYLLDNKEMAKTYKQYFKMLWESAKKS